MNIFQELKWRNYIFNKTNNIKNLLYKKFIIYIGYDPTYKYLHIGHLLSFFLLKILNKYYKNIKIIILIGEYTTKINKYKNINKLYKNIKIIKKQIIYFYKKILNNKNFIIINNYKWFKKITLLNFINKIFKNINIKYLFKNKKYIKNIKNKKIIYPIIQSYDFLYLYKKYKCNFQLGGSDQWRNIILGIKFIKKIYKKKTYALTFPLLTNNNNIKFSKSNKKYNIWLYKNKNKSYDIYQFFINLNDKISIDFLKKISFLSIKNIKYIIFKHFYNIKKKYVQKILSKIIINLIYSNKEYKYAKYLSKYLFNNNNNFLILKKYKKYLLKNINYLFIYKKNIYKTNIIINNIIKIYNISKKKTKYFLNKGYIKFNNKRYDIFISKFIYYNYKYIICNIITKFYFIIKII
ncbi:MAG: tyrosine--tRNA ligase [Candidatus Shikimatogenerans sp. Tduv]|uniref:Tyrosine--tRNA ligase n=1 Tax=Candidatus Shikimatogenerans sp. Tduv TaxID=3158567 RepID=A0AAU7QSR7_9FLAO